MSETKQDRLNDIFTIPNALTMLRFFLVPPMVMFYLRGRNDLAILVLAISALTDILDGWVARTFHMVSALGKVIDPMADKLTQASMLYCLSTTFRPLGFLFAFMIVKELIQGTTTYIVIRRIGTSYSSHWHGKLATVCIHTTVFLHLFWQTIPDMLSIVLVAVTLCMMSLSFVLYSINNVKLYRSGRTNEA